MAPDFLITEAAKKQIVKILKDENMREPKLRIFVTLTNKKGFEYAFCIDDDVNEDDLVYKYQFQNYFFTVLIDSMSIQYIQYSTLDYKQQSDKKELVITN